MKNGWLVLCFLLLGTAVNAQVLRLATYQYADNDRLANIQPLASYLQQQLNHEVQVKSYASVHLFIEAIQSNQVDVALINTFGFLLLETAAIPYPMQPELKLQVKPGTQDNYKTVFVAPASSQINSLEDVKDHARQTSLMLVNVGSTSGNLVPRIALSSAGLKSADSVFHRFSYGKTHKATIDSVVAGKVGLAAIGSSEYFSFMTDTANSAKIRMVWMSPEIPLGPVLLNKALPAKLKDRLLQSLLALHTANPAALDSVKAGWSEATEAERFIEINAAYYDPFKKQLGPSADVQAILKRFAK